MTDILDLIDDALRDWRVSDDAMRWAPPAPIWDEPCIPLRAEGFRYLTDVEGMDGYAAAYYGVIQLGAFGRAFTRAFDGLAKALSEFGRRIAPALKQVEEFHEAAQAARTYGPASRGKR